MDYFKEFNEIGEDTLNSWINKKFHRDPSTTEWYFSQTNKTGNFLTQNILREEGIKIKEPLSKCLPVGSNRHWTGYGIDRKWNKIFFLIAYDNVHNLHSYKPSLTKKENIELMDGTLKDFGERLHLEIDIPLIKRRYYDYIHRIIHLDFLNRNTKKFEFYLIFAYFYSTNNEDYKNRYPTSRDMWRGALEIFKEGIGITTKWKCTEDLYKKYMDEWFIDINSMMKL